MSVFNPDGSYKETYRKSWGKFLKTVMGHYNTPEKKKQKEHKHFRKSNYKDEVDLDEMFKGIPKLKESDKMTNIKKQQPKPVKENKIIKETTTPTEDKEIIVDTIETVIEEFKKPRTKRFNFKPSRINDIESIINRVLFTIYQMNKKGLIGTPNSEKTKLFLSSNNTTEEKLVLCLEILFDSWKQEGLYDLSEDDYKKLQQMYKDIIQ